MNKNTKAVFEILRVEPNEPFKIDFKDGGITEWEQRITPKLYLENFNVKTGNWEEAADILILDLIRGNYAIIKKPKFTEVEQKAIELYKLLGAKYIAKDDTGEVWVYKDKPYKYDSVWDGEYIGTSNLPLELAFKCLNWEDKEPYYIGD